MIYRVTAGWKDYDFDDWEEATIFMQYALDHQVDRVGVTVNLVEADV